jgi:hypothetical protein
VEGSNEMMETNKNGHEELDSEEKFRKGLTEWEWGSDVHTLNNMF